eukprot:ctg_129.g107
MRCHVFGEGTEVVEVLADGPVAVPQRALAPSAVTCTLSDERAVASAQLKTKGADGGAAVRCRRLLPDGVPAEVSAVPEAICLVRLSTAGEAPTVRWVQWSVSVGFCGAFGERIREQSGRAVTTLERLARRYAQRWTPKDAQHFLPALDPLHPSPTPAAPLWPQLVKPTERLGPQRETEPTVLSHDPPPLRRNGVHRPSATPSATAPAASAATMHPASPVAPATPPATAPAASAATMHPASPVAPATPPATTPAASAATMHPASPAALPTSSLPTTSSPTVDKPITHNLPTVSTVANHTRLKFQLHCTPRALQHLADTTHRWVPFVTGNVAELGAWNMNVAKKLDYSADADCFRALVPVHSPHPPGGRLQYAYFLVDDRFGDRCSSRIAFECLAEERAARQPTSAGPSTTSSASEVMPPTIPIRSLKLPPSLPPPPTARTPGRGVIASMPTPAPLTVRDEQVDFGISTGYVRLRVQLPTTSAESLPFADAYRAAGDASRARARSRHLGDHHRAPVHAQCGVRLRAGVPTERASVLGAGGDPFCGIAAAHRGSVPAVDLVGGDGAARRHFRPAVSMAGGGYGRQRAGGRVHRTGRCGARGDIDRRRDATAAGRVGGGDAAQPPSVHWPGRGGGAGARQQAVGRASAAGADCGRCTARARCRCGRCHTNLRARDTPGPCGVRDQRRQFPLRFGVVGCADTPRGHYGGCAGGCAPSYSPLWHGPSR